jgi:hypothetical protein
MLVLDSRGGGWNRAGTGETMKISLRGLADLTNVNSMLLPDFGPNLPGPVVYEGGLSGGIGHLGQSTPTYAPIDTSSYTTLLNNATPYGTLTTSDLSDLGLPPSTGVTVTSSTLSSQTMIYLGIGALAFILILMAAKR